MQRRLLAGAISCLALSAAAAGWLPTPHVGESAVSPNSPGPDKSLALDSRSLGPGSRSQGPHSKSLPPNGNSRAFDGDWRALDGDSKGLGHTARYVGPALVVFITVDQLRADYLTRFQHQLRGGLGRLYREGAFFTNAYQDHANTETAPGHASTMSGRFPASHGITSNSTGVGDSTVTLVGVPSGRGGASPHRFKGTTLADWLIAAHPETRVLSVSKKDRGAILPIGRSKQQVFWWESAGNFTTSTYYRSTLPGWVVAFNARRPAAAYAGRAWELLLPEAQYPEPDTVVAEMEGRNVVFPHVMGSDTGKAGSSIQSFPFLDQITLDMALAGVHALRLGEGTGPDLLAVSLSQTDAIGHGWGPDSRELHDQVLRLDRALGAFLDSLLALRGRDRILIALTADHGVAPFPGVRSADPNRGALKVDLRTVLTRANDSLRRLGATGAVVAGAQELVVMRDSLGKVNREVALALTVTMLRNTPGVLRVDRLSEVFRADTVKDAIARRWRHMYATDSAVDAVVTLKPYSVHAYSSQAQHGTPHDYDAHVPVIFHGRWIRAGKYPEFARVVDMAPTLARILGIRPLEQTDGKVLQKVIR
jgi:hypothetical protein